MLIPGVHPVIFQVEQASACDKIEERAIRIQIKRILGEDQTEIVLDLILSEPSLFVAEKKKYGRAAAPDFVPEIRQDKKTEILSAYRESLSSLPKMDDLALDL